MAAITKTALPAATSTADATEGEPFLTPQRIRLLGDCRPPSMLVAALVVWFTITAGRRGRPTPRRLRAIGAAMPQQRRPIWRWQYGDSTRVASTTYSTGTGNRVRGDAWHPRQTTHLIAGQNEPLRSPGWWIWLPSSRPTRRLRPDAPANNCLGTAYENVSKFPVRRSRRTGRLPDLATVDYLKASSLLDAARAALLANKVDDAKGFYNEIITKYAKSGAMTEAQVRLAEINAKTG